MIKQTQAKGTDSPTATPERWPEHKTYSHMDIDQRVDHIVFSLRSISEQVEGGRIAPRAAEIQFSKIRDGIERDFAAGPIPSDLVAALEKGTALMCSSRADRKAALQKWAAKFGGTTGTAGVAFYGVSMAAAGGAWTTGAAGGVWITGWLGFTTVTVLWNLIFGLFAAVLLGIASVALYRKAVRADARKRFHRAVEDVVAALKSTKNATGMPA